MLFFLSGHWIMQNKKQNKTKKGFATKLWFQSFRSAFSIYLFIFLNILVVLRYASFDRRLMSGCAFFIWSGLRLVVLWNHFWLVPWLLVGIFKSTCSTTAVSVLSIRILLASFGPASSKKQKAARSFWPPTTTWKRVRKCRVSIYTDSNEHEAQTHAQQHCLLFSHSLGIS